MDEPFSARIDGDRMYGRGTCDMKAGVAAMVVAAEHAAAAGTRGDVVLALVADEEHGSLGTSAVLEQLAGRLPDACVVGEPTWLDLIVAHRGFAVVEVELRGRAAHSSRPQDGVNAVAHLGRLLAAVEAAGSELAEPPRPASLMATVARGGDAPFVLPASARAVIERRTLPGEPSAGGLREVEAIVAAARARRDVPRDDGARRVGDGPATRRSQRLVALLGRATPRRRAVLDGVGAVGGARGVPTVVCGPAGGGLHTDVEWVELSQLRAYTSALTELVGAFCA